VGRTAWNGQLIQSIRPRARQVNDVANDLAAWLARNGHGVPVRTAAMVMHEPAVLGNGESQRVIRMRGSRGDAPGPPDLQHQGR